MLTDVITEHDNTLVACKPHVTEYLACEPLTIEGSLNHFYLRVAPLFDPRAFWPHRTAPPSVSVPMSPRGLLNGTSELKNSDADRGVSKSMYSGRKYEG